MRMENRRWFSSVAFLTISLIALTQNAMGAEQPADLFVEASCRPKDLRTIYWWDSPGAIRDIIPAFAPDGWWWESAWPSSRWGDLPGTALPTNKQATNYSFNHLKPLELPKSYVASPTSMTFATTETKPKESAASSPQSPKIAERKVSFDPAKVTNKGQPRTFIVHSFPGETVRLSEKDVWSVSGDYNPIVRADSAILGRPGLVPMLGERKDQTWNEWQNEYDWLAPTPVVIASTIVLSGTILVEDSSDGKNGRWKLRANGLVLIANKIIVEKKVTIHVGRREWSEIDKFGRKMHWIRSGMLYAFAREIEFKNDAKLEINAWTELWQNSDRENLSSGNSLTHKKGFVVILTAGNGADLRSHVTQIQPSTPRGAALTNSSAVAAELVVDAMTDATFLLLQQHYAPHYRGQLYFLGDEFYRQRQVARARDAYEALVALEGKEGSFGRAAAVRLRQIELGYNYLGENDFQLARRDPKAILDDAKAVIDNLNALNLKDLMVKDMQLTATWNSLQTQKVEKEVKSVSESLKQERRARESDLAAARTHMEWARTKLEAARKNLKDLARSKSDSVNGIQREFNNFLAAAASCDKQDSWWDKVVSTLGLFLNVLRGDIQGVIDNLGDLIDDVGKLTDQVDDLLGAFENAANSQQELEDALKSAEGFGKLIKSAAEKGEAIYEHTKKACDLLKGQYSQLSEAKSSCNILWNPVLPPEGGYPEHSYPSPYQMAMLDNAILAAGDSVRLASLELLESRQKIEAAELEITRIGGDLERNEQVMEEVKRMKAFVEDHQTLTNIELESGVRGVEEQFCRMGQRIVDRLTRMAYEVSRSLTYIGLEVQNSGVANANGIVPLKSKKDAAFTPEKFKFNYSYFDSSFEGLKNYIGVSQTIGLTDHFNDLKGNVGASQFTTMRELSSDEVEQFKKSGDVQFLINDKTSPISQQPNIRVRDAHVVLQWTVSGKSTVVTLEKTSENLLRGRNGDIIRIPMENLTLSANQRHLDMTPSTTLADVDDSHTDSIFNNLLSPLFGFSLEGRWQLRLTPPIAGNQMASWKPGDQLKNLTGASVVFHSFSQ